jgi:anti-sigma regulatory factor (Ser/Thr protein kinase)
MGSAPDHVTQPERLTLSIPSHPRYLRVVRNFLSSLLAELGFSHQTCMGMVLAVNEAYANVIEHCYQGDVTQRVDLAVVIEPAVITIEMRDYGAQPDPACIEPRDLQDVRPGGLGTHFMRAIMDDITYDLSSGTGTVLRMSKRRSLPCTSP